jgi:biopolymer transport protein ExbB/TolQ
MNARHFMRELRKRIHSRNPSAALDFCRSKRAGLARVMEQALSHLHLEPGQLRDRIATAIEVEQVEMERNLGVLGTMSNIAPLLGLFGTVIGIIRAFADIARTGSGGSSVVAMGVSEALITTAAGIVIAVIATVFFNAFVRMIRTRIVEMEDARAELFAALSEVEEPAEVYQYEQRQVAVAGAPGESIVTEMPRQSGSGARTDAAVVQVRGAGAAGADRMSRRAAGAASAAGRQPAGRVIDLDARARREGGIR